MWLPRIGTASRGAYAGLITPQDPRMSDENESDEALEADDPTAENDLGDGGKKVTGWIDPEPTP